MKRILLVEDEKDIRDLYRQILTDAGFAVDTAENGEEGFTKAKPGEYDLVLLDIIMPKLDGITVLKRLKLSLPQETKQKVVIMTVLADQRYINDALASGADDYVVKSSLTPEQFLEKIQSILPAN